MFGAKEEMGGTGNQLNGLLEQGCEFEGKLTFEGCVRINGKFKGEIFSEGTLTVGEQAELEGTIEVGNLVVHGKVAGEITAKDRIEMHRPAEVRGNIEAKTLVIEEGVVFEGNCRMGQPVTVSVSLPDRSQEEARDLVEEPDVGDVGAEEVRDRTAHGGTY